MLRAASRLMTHSWSCLKPWAARRSRTVRKLVSVCPSVLFTTYACQDYTNTSFSLLLSSKSRKWPPQFLTLQITLQPKNSWSNIMCVCVWASAHWHTHTHTHITVYLDHPASTHVLWPSRVVTSDPALLITMSQRPSVCVCVCVCVCVHACVCAWEEEGKEEFLETTHLSLFRTHRCLYFCPNLKLILKHLPWNPDRTLHIFTKQSSLCNLI